MAVSAETNDNDGPGVGLIVAICLVRDGRPQFFFFCFLKRRQKMSLDDGEGVQFDDTVQG